MSTGVPTCKWDRGRREQSVVDEGVCGPVQASTEKVAHACGLAWARVYAGTGQGMMVWGQVQVYRHVHICRQWWRCGMVRVWATQTKARVRQDKDTRAHGQRCRECMEVHK